LQEGHLKRNREPVVGFVFFIRFLLCVITAVARILVISPRPDGEIIPSGLGLFAENFKEGNLLM
jgi:hypothetical protein